MRTKLRLLYNKPIYPEGSRMFINRWKNILGVLAVLAMAGCSKNSITYPTPDSDQLAVLYSIQTNVISQFNSFDLSLRFAARQLVLADMQGEQAVSAIQNLAGTNPWIRLAGAVGLDGKPQILYPQVFLNESEPEGRLLTELKNAMPQIRDGYSVMGSAQGNKFKSMLVNYIFPVKGKDQIVIGAVFIQFAADEMLNKIVMPQIVGYTLNIWVVQTDGLIIYDTNPNEINLNVLTDEPFIKYPTLVSCARSIVSRQNGIGYYTFVTKGEKAVKPKSAQWTSVERGGRSWRIVLNLEDRIAQ